MNEMLDFWVNNGYVIRKMEFDGNLCRFDVWFAGELLGSVYPADLVEMQACIDKLDAGLDPVTDNWEDGLGNSCCATGWYHLQGFRE